VYSLLSSLSTGPSSEGVPLLVNAPDAEAWSPIHYCASLKQPSIEVLDVLYCAGADVSLFSKMGNCTPLHCLARRKRGPDALRDQASTDALYRFVAHLVRNLRAPLQAQDHNNETCVHIAAEHGDSAEVLRSMLDSDPEHTVSEMRNSRGYVISFCLCSSTRARDRRQRLLFNTVSHPSRSPGPNSAPCSVVTSTRNGVRRRPPLTLPSGPCTIPLQT